MAIDRSFLIRNGRMWYVRLKIPSRLKDHYPGHTHKRRSLQTERLDEANRLKRYWLEEWRREFDTLEGKSGFAAKADEFRRVLAQTRAEHSEAAVDALEDQAQMRAEEIEKEHGLDAAQRFYRLATTATPTLCEAMEEWLPTAGSREGTRVHYRAAVAGLLTFLGGDRVPADVSDDDALRYFDELVSRSKTKATFQRKMRPLGSFWEWMGMRRYVPRTVNLWRGFKWPKERAKPKTKRAYSDDELMTLLSGTASYKGSLGELIVLGLYTGARIDELCALRCGDVETGRSGTLLRLGQGGGKTAAAIREPVVVHPVPAGILKERGKGNRKAWLFPDLIPGGPDGKRSWHASKAFGRYRDGLKLPRAVDFHSLRRTLVTLLENKGVPLVPIARYIGHKVPGMTLGTYSDGSTRKTMKQTAEAVKYPARIEKAMAAFLLRSAVLADDTDS